MYRINNNDFKILQKYKTFLLDLDNALENVPRKDMFYKDNLKSNGILLLELILKASYDDKEKYYSQIKSKISLLDFELERLSSKKYISLKKLDKLCLSLIEINKMTITWLNNESKSN